MNSADCQSNETASDTQEPASNELNPLPDSLPEVPLSKNRQKKLARRERAQQAKRERKQRDKEARLAKAIAEGRDLQAEEQFRVERTLAGDSKQRKQLLWEQEKLPIIESNFEICLDCNFEDLMTEREIASLGSQIRYCYAYNKRAKFPCRFTVTNLSGQTLQHLQKETGFHEWENRAFVSTDRHFTEHFAHNASVDNSSEQENGPSEAKRLVYLTSDSENVLSELKDNEIYIIGGIVDRNRLKGKCYDEALKYNVAHARLPLERCLAKMPSTKVLTCNHVFGILLQYREQNENWAEALQQILPNRKGAEYKNEE